MTVSPFPIAARERSATAAIARAAAAVALLDGLWAIVLWTLILQRATPARVFQGIASALMGRAARDAGAASVALGLALHICVATGWATVYYVLLRAWPRFRALAGGRSALALGVAFGAVVWLVMNLVVVRLTLARPTAVFSWLFLVNLAGHMVVVGPPIAMLMKREATG